jgi:hypothetical protein
MQRKLAAILAASAVGYSTLVEHDDTGTFDLTLPTVFDHQPEAVEVGKEDRCGDL